MVSDTRPPPSSGGGVFKGPKPLTFPDRPLIPTKIAIFDDREYMPKPLFPKDEPTKVAQPALVAPKPLTFGNATPPSPPPTQKVAGKPLSFDNVVSKPVQKVAQVGNLFATDDDSSTVSAAVKYVQDNFPQLANRDRIERQIRQLSPLNLTVLMDWGASALTEAANLSSECAKVIKTFSTLGAAEYMEGVLKHIKGDNPSNGFLSKWFNSSTPQTLSSFKPRLTILKSEQIQINAECNRLFELIKQSEARMTLLMAALAAICNVVGTPTDDSMNRAMHDRRTILSQGVNQSQLVNLQLNQMRSVLTDQINRLDQLLNVTLPAYEMANATK